MELVEEHGNDKWVLVASLLGSNIEGTSRTDNSCKKKYQQVLK
jgi:hypothetical protein